MTRHLFYIPILASCTIYFVVRILMRILSIDHKYVFFYKMKDLQFFFDDIDIFVTVLFFICLFKYLRSTFFAKLVLVFGLIICFPLSLFSYFVYGLDNNIDVKLFLSAENPDDESSYLLIINHHSALHPDEGDPREVYLFQQTLLPYMYEKISQSKKTVSHEVLLKTPELTFTGDKITIEVGKDKFHMERLEKE